MLASHTLLDFSTAGPGPRCTRLLADYGVRVIKIRPPAGGTRMLTTPWYTYSADRGIRQIHVDLKQEAGRRLVHRMLERADVLLESYRPGVAARLGLGYEEVRATNEGIVYCSVSGYGQQGPYAQWPAHDLNWLALGGFLHGGSRREAGGPALPGAVVADAAGGYSAAVAVLAALVRKAATGEGAYLDVSVVDSVLRVMQAVFDARLAGENLSGKQEANEASGPPGMLTGGSACYDVYQAADGR
ncbi:MAG: L-carnitine dehydratase/bile acid-inducible protein [Actinomycetia bacterium]|nr:L-carnitine dehydratase/bile acid-inducible protein [Actinomycetes bacterium]